MVIGGGEEKLKRFRFHLKHRFMQTRDLSAAVWKILKRKRFLSNNACDIINHHKTGINSSEKKQSTSERNENKDMTVII